MDKHINTFSTSLVVIKVKKGDLKLHSMLSQIYTYSDTDSIAELAATMIEIGQREPIIINRKNEILSGGRRWMAANSTDKIEYLDALVVADNNQNEAVNIFCHNQQRVKTMQEVFNETQIILNILGNRQGKRNDLTKGESNPFGVEGSNKFEIAAKVVGKSATTLRNMIDVLKFNNESEEHKSLGLLEKVLNEGLAPSRAKAIAQDVREVIKQRAEAQIRPMIMEGRFNEGDSTIYNKSSHDMSEVEAGSVQVVFTSPVYYNLRNYNNSTECSKELGQESTPEEYITNLTNHFADVYRVLKDEGSFFLNIGETYQDREALMIPARLVLALRSQGWYVVNEIIWHKTNTIPQSHTRRLKPTYEKIYHLVKNVDTYYYEEYKIWNGEPMRVVKGPADRNTSTTGVTQSGYMLTRPYKRFKDFIDAQNCTDVILGNNAAVRQRELNEVDDTVKHCALMPDYLPLLPILTTSRPGDIVLDPFSGSATTGKTALLTGRNYIGYELNTANFNLSNKDMLKTIKEKSIECIAEMKFAA